MPDAMTHPTPQELTAFGLGKLREGAAAAVAVHLVSCPACRQAVAAVPPDSFLGKVRAAGPTGSTFPPGLAQPVNALSRVDWHAVARVAGSEVPAELLGHPKFLILGELGRGGMGVVYEARHKQMDRQVVIKVINRSLLDQPGALDRFRREVQAAAQLSHPNIVTAYDAEQAGELHMLVMEFIPGQSLAEVLKKHGPLPVVHACNYLRQVALGLQHAHEHGMVHRDIKPQNLMLTPKGQVKILDFGLAKLASERGTGPGLTAEGAYMGTPEYCAPEQAKDARMADIRADIYSLGCTLYCLLAGRPPFCEDTAIQTILAHLQKQPQPLPELRPDVTEQLWGVVARLLAKGPEQRFQKPIEVVQALAAFVKPSPKPGATRGPAPALGVGSAGKGTRLDADTNQIKNVLREVLDRAPPKEMPARAEAPPRENPVDTFALPGDKKWQLGVKAIGVTLVMAVVLLGLGLLAGGVFKVKTPDGTIVLKGLPDDAEVTVDGGRVIVKPIDAQDGNTFEVRVDPGKKHRLEVKKGGFKVFGEEVEIDAGGRRLVIVHLERNEQLAQVPKPPDDNGKQKPNAEDRDKWVSLFNGKDKTGWKTEPNWDGGWRVEDGVLFWNSPDAFFLLWTERDDYRDFHLRVETRIKDKAYGHLIVRDNFGQSEVLTTLAQRHGGHAGYMIALNSTNENSCKTGSLFAPSSRWIRVSKSPVPPDQWFTLEVIAEGNRVVVKVNGQTTADYSDPERPFVRGHISLLMGGQRSIEFRKIEIKELPPEP